MISVAIVALTCQALGFITLLKMESPILFDEIPQEVIVSKIFSFFSVRERQIIRRVCTAWKDTIDTFFGQCVQITNKNWERILHSNHVAEAKFTNWTRDLTFEGMGFTERISKLEIASPLTPLMYYNTLPLLKSCKNLSNLIIRNIVGAYVQSIEEMDYTIEEWILEHDKTDEIWFPNLKTFTFLDDWKSRSETVGSYSQGCCRKKSEFITFLFHKMGKLTKLKNLKVKLSNSFWWFSLHQLFVLNLSDDMEGSVFAKELPYQPLIQIPLKALNKTLLEKVEIEYQNFLTVQFKFHSGYFGINGIRQLESFKSFISQDAIAGNCPKLDYLRAQEIHSLWSEILKTQFSLLQFDGKLTFDTSDHLLPILRNNTRTLQDTRISTSSANQEDEENIWQEFDFGKQNKLRHLSFMVDQIEENQQEASRTTHPFLKHIKNLPDSLVKLEISCPLHLELEKEETIMSGLGECLGHLKNLRELELWNKNSLPWFVINGREEKMLKKSFVEGLMIILPKLVVLKFNFASSKDSSCECNCCACNFEEDDVETRSLESSFGKIIDVEILTMKYFQNKCIQVVTEMGTVMETNLIVPKQMSIYIKSI